MYHVLDSGGGGRGRPIPIRLRYLFLVATVFCGSLLLLSINSRTELLFIDSNALSPSRHTHRPLDDHGTFTIKTEGCTIPQLLPFDVSVKMFIAYPDKFKTCPHANNPLLGRNDTHIWVIADNYGHYDLPDADNITCCYQSFYRPSAISDILASDIDERVMYEPCIHFAKDITVSDEFVKVTCEYEYETHSEVVYVHYFLFAQKKELDQNLIEASQNQSAYNVIILGLDAVSRLNFYRTMPKTLKYLQKKGAIELSGYNKVGDNTFPNLSPMLLGLKVTELKTTCWPNRKATFDNCPFVWEWFREAGFYTALGEDSASLGTFNFEKTGFSRSPTDYYLHTFMNEAESHIGNNKDFNSFICMGHEYFYKVLLDYVERLIANLKFSKFFGFFWEVTMSHDYLNYPMLMDNNYELFLNKLEESNYLNNTIVMFLSDHGIRWGDIRVTKQGRLEERLPLVNILLPQSFQDNHREAYNNLKLNRHRLTTPYDIHATLLDLVNLDVISDEKINSRSTESYSNSRSISLFLPVPTNRTCEIAGIDDHWCTCHSGNKISTESKEAKDAAGFLVKYLNDLIHGHRVCAKLTLSAIDQASEMTVGTPEDDEVGWREFLVTVRTVPGDGVFEATMRVLNNQWSVAGTVSRLNLYGEQSHCMHDYQLKLYCYCH